MKIAFAVVSLAAIVLADGDDNKPKLSLPEPDLCANRVKHMNFNGHNYLFSWQTQDAGQRTWFHARNYCRDRCMDLVSLETGEENEMMKRHAGDIGHGQSVWTSGRLCNFNDDCKAERFQPLKINGWFWATTKVPMLPTDQQTPFSPRRAVNDWSKAGNCGAQPDQCNNRVDEACMTVGNNVFNDGIAWHDETCHENRMFICEDSDELINFVRFNNRHLNI